MDEKARTATITPHGARKAEEYFRIESLNDPENLTLAHHINQAIKARGVMQKDVDYVVKDGEVIIVDEFTGRLMIGRRYNEGCSIPLPALRYGCPFVQGKISGWGFNRRYIKIQCCY